jgi:hypothetical protein
VILIGGWLPLRSFLKSESDTNVVNPESKNLVPLKPIVESHHFLFTLNYCTEPRPSLGLKCLSLD